MIKASSSIPQDYESLKDEYIGIATELNSTQAEVEKLKHELAWLKKQVFGQKSERFVDNNQLSLDGLALDKKEVDPSPKSNPEHNKTTINRAKPGKKRLPKDLPRRQVIHLPPEVEGKEDEFEKIGQDINEELNYIPSKFEVVEHVYPKYKYKTQTDGKIYQALAIDRPIYKGRPGTGLLAQLLVAKYCDHMPLDRQVKIFKRLNIAIPKSTMVHWTAKCHELLTPICEKMKKQILSGDYVLSDDTPVRVLDKNKPGTTHRGYLWIYGDLNQVVYDYTPGRSREGPHTFLNGYTGFLQTDGYTAYNGIPTEGEITRMGCWSHARREFFELKDSEAALTEVPLRLAGKLFAIDKEYFGSAINFETRKSQAETVLHEFKKWLDETIKNVLPASTIALAIKYCLNQWDRLTVYYKYPHLRIDNNFSERCVKSAVIGRKNWLFFGSHEGGKRSATIYSLVESCKLQGHNPWEYLNDVLSRLDETPMNIENLTPLNWKKPERV